MCLVHRFSFSFFPSIYFSVIILLCLNIIIKVASFITDFENWIRGRRGGSISILYPFLENTCMLFAWTIALFCVFFSDMCFCDIVMKAHIPSCILSFFSPSSYPDGLKTPGITFSFFPFFFFSSSYYLLLMLSSSLDKTSVHLYSFSHSMS